MVSAEPITIRASSLPAFQDCQLRAAANTHSRLFREHGHELLPYCGNIGAVIGSGVHAGAEVGLSERMFGTLAPLDALEDAAIEGFRKRLDEDAADGMILDDDTPTHSVAERQVRRMIGRYREDVVASARPVAVESRIKAEFRPGVTLSGQSDLLHLDATADGETATVRDLKTSRHKSTPFKHASQLGAYSLLFRSRGHETAAAQIDYLRRVKIDKQQPQVEQQPLDVVGCEIIATAVLNDFSTKLAAFAADGDPHRFLPNATSRLCSGRFCRLFGQPSCPATYQG